MPTLPLKTFWVLFPILFVIVLAMLITTIIRVVAKGGNRKELGVTIGALLLYFLTALLGRYPLLHMPVSNIAELVMLYNIVYFWKKRDRMIPIMNIVALTAIACDFGLHYILQ